MSDSIIAAMISAAASVTVGLIGKGMPVAAPAPSSADSDSARKALCLVILCLIAWLLISPVAIHHDFAGMNFYVISIVIFILVVARPLPPLSAAWISLATYSVNFFLVPLSNRLAVSPFDNQIIRTDLPA